MVRRDVAAQKITSARSRLAAADEIFARQLEEFLEDQTQRDLATFYLFRAIQGCLDLAAHWLAERQWGPPDQAGEAFETLRERGVLDDELAHGLRSATGLRNRIAHGYTEIKPDRMWAEYRDGTAALKRFLAIVAAEAGLRADLLPLSQPARGEA